MRNIVAYFGVAMVAAFLFAGCAKGPDDVAVEFLETFAEGDYEGAAEYACKDTKVLCLKMAGETKGMTVGNEFTGAVFEALETKIDGDTATVKVKMSKDGEEQTVDAILIKEEGEWKTVINKDVLPLMT